MTVTTFVSPLAAFNPTDTTFLATAAVAVLGIIAAVVAFWYYERYVETREETFDEFADQVEVGEPVDFSPPDVSFNIVDYLKVARHLQRGQRLAKKGYVKWYRLDSTLSSPKWVKPEQDGAGVPKVTISGQPYYFPKDAMVSDERTGAWVALHREGEGDPVNLRDPAYPGMETDLVERTINLEAEDKPPGWLDNLNLSDQALLYGGMGLLFVLYAMYQYMNGGL